MELTAHFMEAISSFLTSESQPLLFLIVAILSILLYVVYGETRSEGTHPPLPRPWRFPIFGNLPQLAPFPHEALTKFGKTFGDVFAVQLGSWDVLVINSINAAREALFQKSAYFSSRPPFFTLQLGNSQDYTVAFGDYNPAQIQRKKALLQAFHRVILNKPEHLNKMVVQEASRMNQILKNTGGSPFDPRACLKMVICRMVYRLTFGGSVGHEEELDLFHLSKTGREFQESSTLVLLSDFMPWMKFAVKRQRQKLEDLVKLQLHKFVLKAYRRRKAQNILEQEDYCTAKNIEDFIKSLKRQEKLALKNPGHTSGKTPQGTIIKGQLQGKTHDDEVCISEEAADIHFEDSVNMAGRVISEEARDANTNHETKTNKIVSNESPMKQNEQISTEIEGTFDKKDDEFTTEEEQDIEMRVVQMLSSDAFGAGLENLSSLLSWSVAYIASNEELQHDLHEEIDRVIGHDGKPSVQHKQKMPLMQATILETLRLSSVIPMAIPHYCIKDSVVKGYHVAKGTVVLTNIWGINHDDRHFSHPECFEPYRFLDLKGQLRADRCSLVIPFNTGPRTCAGNAVTKVVIFLLVASLLQKFELRSAKNLVDLRPLPGPLLAPDFFEVVFHPRNMKKHE